MTWNSSCVMRATVFYVQILALFREERAPTLGHVGPYRICSATISHWCGNPDSVQTAWVVHPAPGSTIRGREAHGPLASPRRVRVACVTCAQCACMSSASLDLISVRQTLAAVTPLNSLHVGGWAEQCGGVAGRHSIWQLGPLVWAGGGCRCCRRTASTWHQPVSGVPHPVSA